MRLIDANAICIKPEFMENICGCVMMRVEDLSRILVEQPTIEQPPIVRCKDCKYCTTEEKYDARYPKCELKHNWMPQPDWFCADGEPKDGES